MAIIQYGALAQELSGSVGGVTFARVHDAKTCRAWRAPVVQHSPQQQTMRNLLARFSHFWGASETQFARDSWDTYAPTCTFTNALGQPYTISGFNMYCRNLAGLLYYGLPISAGPPPDFYVAPALPGFPQTLTLTISFTHATGVLALTATAPAPPPPAYYAFSIHQYMPASRQFPRRQPVGVSALNLSIALPQTIFTYATAPPGVAGSVRSVIIARSASNDNALGDSQILTVLST